MKPNEHFARTHKTQGFSKKHWHFVSGEVLEILQRMICVFFEKIEETRWCMRSAVDQNRNGQQPQFQCLKETKRIHSIMGIRVSWQHSENYVSFYGVHVAHRS